MYICMSGVMGSTQLSQYWVQPRSYDLFELRERWMNAQYECAKVSISLRIPVFRRDHLPLKLSGFTHPSMKKASNLEAVTSRALEEDFCAFMEKELTACIPIDIYREFTK